MGLSPLTRSPMTITLKMKTKLAEFVASTRRRRGRLSYVRYVTWPSQLGFYRLLLKIWLHHVLQERLLGLLMPFRAFGDVKFKWSIELQKRVLESGPDQLHENEHTKFIPPNYHTPPYLTAEPEITHHKLRPQDRFLVSTRLQKGHSYNHK